MAGPGYILATVTLLICLVVMLWGGAAAGTPWVYSVAAWLAIVVIVCAVALYVRTYLRTARVVITDGDVIKSSAGWPATRLRRDRVYGLGAPLIQPGERRVFPIVFLRERGGDGQSRGRGRRIKLIGWYWDPDVLARICAELEIPMVETLLSVGEYEELAPGVLSFRYRRPWLWVFTVVLGSIIALVGLVLLWSQLAHTA